MNSAAAANSKRISSISSPGAFFSTKIPLAFVLISVLASPRDLGHIRCFITGAAAKGLGRSFNQRGPVFVICMRKIRIAIVGVGNCASSLVQGINFYHGSSPDGSGAGLLHRQIGPYRPGDIEVVAAFDIDRRKVGLDGSKAIFSPPHFKKVCGQNIKLTGTIVNMGCGLDGFDPYMLDQEPTR